MAIAASVSFYNPNKNQQKPTKNRKKQNFFPAKNFKTGKNGMIKMLFCVEFVLTL